MKKSIKKPQLNLLPEFTAKNNLPWVSTSEFKPKLIKQVALSETKSSAKVMVRWRFTEYSGDKWKYAMGRYFETAKNICGPWWQIEGAKGAIEVSHFCIIKKPE
jgi:hypothetical protein